LLQGSLKTILMQLFPLQWGAKYQPILRSRLLALNLITTNALGFTAAEFTGLLLQMF
jgi:hypothetical protein